VQAFAGGKALRRLGQAYAWAWLGLAGGCATTQIGLVDTPVSVSQPQAIVLFDWQPKNAAASSGSMSATLSDGTHYEGQFFRVAKRTDPATYKPAWDGWTPYWPEWTGAHDWTSFQQQYESEVIANVVAAGGAGDRRRLRCRFELKRPAVGLSGGASGVCQSSMHESIDGVVMPGTP